MTKISLVLCYVFFLLIRCNAQQDSTDNAEPHYMYLAGNINAATNTIGTFNRRISPSLEYGYTFGIFDLGLATGKLNLIKNDTSWFAEIRPTINIFSKGRFSEALCLGAGYRINAAQGFMTEICNSINFNISILWSVSIIQGYYFFDGKTSNTNAQFMGINVTRNFIKRNGKNDFRKRRSLLN